MKSFLSNAVAKLNVLTKTFNLSRLLVVGLASLILLGSTACNPSGPEVSGTGSYHDTDRGQKSELYDSTQKKVGGANQFNDDARYDMGRSGDRAKALVDRAERNAQQVKSPAGYFNKLKNESPVGERVRTSVENTKSTLNQMQDEVVEGTKQGTKNIKRNTENAAKAIQGNAEDTLQNARKTGRDLSNEAKQTTNDAANYAQDKAKGAVDRFEQAGDEAASRFGNRG